MNNLWVGRNELGEILSHVRDTHRLAAPAILPPPPPRPVPLQVIAIPSPRMPSPVLASRPASPVMGSPMFRTPPLSRPGSPLSHGLRSPRMVAFALEQGSGHDARFDFGLPLPGPVPIPPSYTSPHAGSSPRLASRVLSPAFSEPPPMAALPKSGSPKPLPAYGAPERSVVSRSDMIARQIGLMQAMSMKEKHREMEVEMQKTRMLLALRDMKARELRTRLLSQQHLAQRSIPVLPQYGPDLRQRRYSLPVSL